jgi:acetolactate synthase I/II/III large subunit
VSKKMDARSSMIRTPDLGAVARAYGCRGQQARTLDQVRAGVDEFMAGDGPMLLDIRVSRSVISVPYSRLWYGVDV